MATQQLQAEAELGTLATPTLAAGGALATVSAGCLMIESGKRPAHLVIEQGLAADEFIVRGAGETLVNGTDAVRFFGVTHDLRVQLDSSGDTLELRNSSLPRDVRIIGGAGPVSLHVGNCRLGRNLSIYRLTGLDNIQIDQTHVAGDVAVASHAGGVVLAMRDGSIGGDLLIGGGDPQGGVPTDTTIQAVRVKGTVEIKVDGGQSLTYIGPDTSIAGDLLLLSGQGESEVLMERALVGGSTTIRSGGYRKTVSLCNSVFRGRVRLDGGPGINTLVSEGNSFQHETAVKNF